MSPRIAVVNGLGIVVVGILQAGKQGLAEALQLVIGIEMVDFCLCLAYYAEFRVAQAVASTGAFNHGEVESTSNVLTFLDFTNHIETLPVLTIQHGLCVGKAPGRVVELIFLSSWLESQSISTYPHPGTCYLDTIVRAKAIIFYIAIARIAGSHSLSFDREHILARNHRSVFEYGVYKSHTTIEGVVISYLDTSAEYIAVVLRTLQAAIVGRETPATTYRTPCATIGVGKAVPLRVYPS